MPSKLLSTFVRAPLFWLGSVLLFAGVGVNLTAQDGLDSGSAKKVTTKILREGTRVESRVCECRNDGNQLSIQFDSDGGRNLIALENLTAQRILQAASDDPSDKHWTITGTITEFQGRNYILLERVTRVSK